MCNCKPVTVNFEIGRPTNVYIQWRYEKKGGRWNTHYAGKRNSLRQVEAMSTSHSDFVMSNAR